MATFLLATIPFISVDESRFLTITGNGKTFVKATLADIRVGVEIEGKTAPAVQNELAEKMNKLLEALKKESPDKVDTSSFSVSPEYTNSSPPEIKSYRGRGEITVTTGVEQAGKVIATALDAGANHINGVDLKASEKQIEEAHQVALKKACEQAMNRSKIVLEALGLEFKEIETVDVQPGNRGVYPIRNAYTPLAFTAKASVEPTLEGEQEVQADINFKLRFKEK